MLLLSFFRRHIFIGVLIAVVFIGALGFFIAPQFTRSRLVEFKNAASGAAAALTPILASDLTPTPFTTPASENGIMNFLVLGAAGPGYDAPDLTDTILLVRLDKNADKIYLFSLPRDLLVKIPGTASWNKLNTLYEFAKNKSGHEFDLIKQKVQNISGLAIDHYALVNLSTVKSLVDIVGGVNVMVKKDILDRTFPGPNHSYQTFQIQAGWRYLDGETALKYMRSRHSLSGDFDRIERQQDVLQALKQKILQFSPWDLPKLLDIFGAVSSETKTDLDLWQIKDYWEQTKNIPAELTVKTDLASNDLVATGQMNLGGVMASIVLPKAGLENYTEIQKYIAQIINN